MYVTAFKRELFLDIVWAFLIKQLFHSRFVGYEIVIANSATPGWLSTISYPTRARGIIVNYTRSHVSTVGIILIATELHTPPRGTGIMRYGILKQCATGEGGR